jgi:F420-0:gamma-glutamyl ligase
MLQYLKTKSTQYDRIYEDMVRPLKNAGIDESNFPTKATIAPVSQSATAPTFDKEALKAIVKAKFLK